jgi:hypothetical protein
VILLHYCFALDLKIKIISEGVVVGGSYNTSKEDKLQFLNSSKKIQEYETCVYVN